MRRLLSFDYVIEHPDLPWLPTESEKVAAFEALGIGRSAMPVRVYRGAAGGARGATSRAGCPWRWTPAAPCSPTPIPAGTPRPRSGRGGTGT